MANENARERELHRHYQPWLETFHTTDLPTLPTNGGFRGDGHVPQSSTDKALTSFAQLGALRLGCKRGVVTLIDGKRQYILAESTRTLSLMDDSIHDPGDELWLGNSMLPRGQGMSEYALRPTEYTATDPDGTTYKAPAMVIKDTTVDEQFKTKAFAGSGVTFYAGVPLITRLGHSIGVYSVTDNKPRFGLNAQELRFMVDMSSIVVQHLVVIKNEVARARGERLVQGIGAFIEGCRAPDAPTHPDESLDKDNLVFTNGTSYTAPKDYHERPPLGRQRSSGQFKGMTVLDANTVGRRNYSSYNNDDDVSPTLAQEEPHSYDAGIEVLSAVSQTPSLDHKFISFTNEETHEKNTVVLPANPQDLECQRKRVFGRASKILRRSLGADGIAFLDASSANLSRGMYRRQKESPKTDTAQPPRMETGQIFNPVSAVSVEAPTDDRETGDSSSDNQGSSETKAHSMKSDIPCEFIAGSIQSTQPRTPLRLSQRSLLKLLRRYPQGKCYSFDEDGRLASSDEGSESAVSNGYTSGASHESNRGSKKFLGRKHPLLNLLPGTRTIVFLPLWDFVRDRWNSAAIIWSTHPARLMNIQDDVAYLAAFGNSVMNELARQNLLVSDSAKANFLANISHELRSPLHGILGSIEFLHESPLDDFQSNMVINVETCGKTLLDTINHVLDFTKLNNLSKVGQKGITQATTSDSSLTRGFDLAVVVEEAVEAVYAGQVFRTANADALEGKGPPLSSYNRAILQRQETKDKIALGQAALSADVKLTLNIDNGSDWGVFSQPGAIRRIIMNLLGNSLKYTERGSISVSMELDKSRKATADEDHRHAVIIVSDTGKGMSDDFVKNHAFTAFSQENSLASGTGLGLSIIRQIVDSLGGKIDMRSQKNVGTEIKVWLSLQISNAKPERSILHQMQERTGGLTMCLLDPRGDYSPTYESKPSTPRSGLGTVWTVDESLRSLTRQWFSMHVFTAANMDNVSTDFFVYAEPPPIEYLLHQHGRNGNGSETPVLIFCQNAFQANSLRANGIHHLTEVGRIIEVIAQPVGPQKLAKVLQRCMQRRQKLDEPSDAKSIDHVTRRLRESDEIKAPPPHARKTSNRRPVTPDAVQGKSQGGLSMIRPGLTHRQTAPPPDSPKHVARVKPQSTFSEDGQKDPAAPRVLVVDDNDINLQLLVAFVRKAKLSFEPASNGLLALEAYKRSAFSAALRFKYVVMDISMPVMDGITACREMRKFEKQERMEPADIIALTGMGEERDVKEEAKEAGFTKFMTKPIRFQVLRELLI